MVRNRLVRARAFIEVTDPRDTKDTIGVLAEGDKNE
jgi:hypothetical protein